MRRLVRDGEQAEHIITMGWRGASDQQIRERLLDSNLLFLTQDEDFLIDQPTAAIVVLSRVRQSRRLEERVQVWRQAIHELVSTPRPERQFELLDDGRLVPWDQTL